MHDSHYEIFFFIDTNFPHAYNLHIPYYFVIYSYYCFHIILLVIAHGRLRYSMDSE